MVRRRREGGKYVHKTIMHVAAEGRRIAARCLWIQPGQITLWIDSFLGIPSGAGEALLPPGFVGGNRGGVGEVERAAAGQHG